MKPTLLSTTARKSLSAGGRRLPSHPCSARIFASAGIIHGHLEMSAVEHRHTAWASADAFRSPPPWSFASAAAISSAMKSLRLRHQSEVEASSTVPVALCGAAQERFIQSMTLAPVTGWSIAGHLQRLQRGHQQAHRLQIQRDRAVGGDAAILCEQRPRHLTAFREVGRPVAVAQGQELDPHLLGQRPRRRRVRLRQVVHAVGIAQFQINDPPAVEADKSPRR